MEKNKKQIFILASFIGAFLLVAIVMYYTHDKAPALVKADSKNIDLPKEIHDFMATLKKRWEWGDIEGDYARQTLNCPKLLEFNDRVGPNYLRCNPLYIQCYFSKHPYIKGELKIELKEMITQNKTVMSFEVLEAQNKLYDFKVSLDKTCHEVELPRGEYKLDSLGGESWSNIGREIWIDKFLVSQLDYKLSLGENLEEVKDLGLPALGLPLREQKNFCHSQGKRLMSTHLFEAAIRMPPSLDLSPYPWTKYSQKSKLGLAQTQINEESCRRSYLKECFKIKPWHSYDTDSVSWSGIHDVFGGPPERFESIYKKDQNYKLADFDISFKSEFAKIGFKSSIQDHSQVGFRCYREVNLD